MNKFPKRGSLVIFMWCLINEMVQSYSMSVQKKLKALQKIVKSDFCTQSYTLACETDPYHFVALRPENSISFWKSLLLLDYREYPSNTHYVEKGRRDAFCSKDIKSAALPFKQGKVHQFDALLFLSRWLTTV